MTRAQVDREIRHCYRGAAVQGIMVVLNAAMVFLPTLPPLKVVNIAVAIFCSCVMMQSFGCARAWKQLMKDYPNSYREASHV